jgi:hypothetical protein
VPAVLLMSRVDDRVEFARRNSRLKKPGLEEGGLDLSLSFFLSSLFLPTLLLSWGRSFSFLRAISFEDYFNHFAGQ